MHACCILPLLEARLPRRDSVPQKAVVAAHPAQHHAVKSEALNSCIDNAA